MRGTASVPLGPSITMRGRLGTARALCYNARYRLGAARALYYNARYRLGASITMRGTALVPLGPSITMRGTASVPLGPLLQCAVPASVPLGPSITMRGTASRYRFGPLEPSITMRSDRHPVWVFTRFYLDQSEELPRNHKTNGKRRNATLRLYPALLQTGRSTLAPRHSKCTSRSTILFGCSVACRLLVQGT